MEQIKKDGLAKSIGVSNFREEDIAEMSKSWTVPPAVNQVSRSRCVSARQPLLMSDRIQPVHLARAQHGPLGQDYEGARHQDADVWAFELGPPGYWWSC